MGLSSPPSPSEHITSNEPQNIFSLESIASHSDPSVEVSSSNARTEPRSSPKQVSISISNGDGKASKKKKKKRALKSNSATSSADSSSISQQRGLRVTGKSKNTKVLINGWGDGGRRLYSQTDALALPLGMSIAAFVAQVLDGNNVGDGRMSADHLSLMCTSAVKESLANVYGDRFDCFVRNFGVSFGCTLRTLRLVNEASLKKGEHLGDVSIKSDHSAAACNNEEPLVDHSSIESVNTEASISKHLDEHNYDQVSSALKSRVCQSASLGGYQNDPSCSALKSSVGIPTISEIRESLENVEEMQKHVRLDSVNREITLAGDINQQLACIAPRKIVSGSNDYSLNTFERSVMEQARSNDLKEFEIGLKLKELRLRESQLSLRTDSNYLDWLKISIGISKASFKTEKFKTQLEETRHAELLKKCIDCLVAGLFVMSASLLYGAYVYSYKRISEATTSCASAPQESKSWWMPKQVGSFNSAWHIVKCHCVVWSRQLFGIFMILAIAYLLLQRSSSSKKLMPVTHIVFLLGIMCGIAGKLCVDTMGGNGNSWLLYWEALCLLHFLVNICTSTFFLILHGSVSVSQGVKSKAQLPYWLRRVVFYTVVLVLPLLCGLMPFAGPSDWADHFISLATDSLFASVAVEGN